MHEVIKKTLERFEQGQRTRILAFGSSNTEHFLPGMHWFDCVDVALCHKYGRQHIPINTGIGGDTSRGLLERFEDDAEMFKPHLVFLTIGGNDCNPEKNLLIDEFESNLRELDAKLKKLGAQVVFQTYYAPDPDEIDPVRLNTFYEYSDIVRKVASETGSYLIDHLARWEPFRQKHNAEYKKLMHDGFHVNRYGNMVMGVDIAREFMVPLGAYNDPWYDDAFWADALRIQAMMDNLQQ